MVNRQLELGFEHEPGPRPACHRGERRSRAHWWFDQMREVASRAHDWEAREPAGTPPESAGWRFSRGRRWLWE